MMSQGLNAKKVVLSFNKTTFFVWTQLGLNQRPPDYESGATNQLSYRSNNLKIFLLFVSSPPPENFLESQLLVNN